MGITQIVHTFNCDNFLPIGSQNGLQVRQLEGAKHELVGYFGVKEDDGESGLIDDDGPGERVVYPTFRGRHLSVVASAESLVLPLARQASKR